MLGVVVLHSDNSITTRYFHTDNLGSIAVITKRERPRGGARQLRRLGQAALPERGGRPVRQHREPDHARLHRPGRSWPTSASCISTAGSTTRWVGRMMSADPIVPDPMNGQAWMSRSALFGTRLARLQRAKQQSPPWP
jgi:hypothetical protein